MKTSVDIKYIVDSMKLLINTPSTTSYYEEILPVIEKMAEDICHHVTYDRKHTAYIRLDGEDTSKTVCVGAHLDTIGLCVRCINSDGTIKVRSLGGINYASLEGENVLIHTRNKKSYSGMMICTSHSMHVFDDTGTLARNDSNMVVILDEKVSSKKEVEALGILSGDIISIMPRFQCTDNGFIKSRFIDDKAAVAIIFGVLKMFSEKNIKPKYNTIFAFPHYEEVGHGGSFLPGDVEEYVGIDIGLIGPELNGSEYKVSICAKDAFTPYDRALTNKLISIAANRNLDYAVDVFYRYGTDGNAAIKGGANISTAAFGMGTLASHGVERTHISAIENTSELLVGYLLD